MVRLYNGPHRILLWSYPQASLTGCPATTGSRLAHQVDLHILAQRKCRVFKCLQCPRLIPRQLNGENRGSNSVSLTHFWALLMIYLLGTNMRGCVRNFPRSLRYNRYKKSDENRSQMAVFYESFLAVSGMCGLSKKG